MYKNVHASGTFVHVNHKQYIFESMMKNTFACNKGLEKNQLPEERPVDNGRTDQ